MPIKYVKFIPRQMVQANPEARFVFGDNTMRIGFGGQAASMRGEPNSIGICTKIKPYMTDDSFFSDNGAEGNSWSAIVMHDISKVYDALDENRIVYVPYDGLGTGLSELPTRAPRIYQMIVDAFEEMSGEECPW